MKISLDLHGVVDADPVGFGEFAKELMEAGHEVYIMTGALYEDAISELAELKFNLNHVTEIISITDYLVEKGLPWEYDKHGRPSFAEAVYWGSKGQIARARGFDLHIDDHIQFATLFSTPFMLYEGKF